ncbi:MAG: hypothetical protein JO252_28540 [Planctomycetaceae bacterium]|nr:hypothetical protein [Planctomycetaceae bacterium]
MINDLGAAGAARKLLADHHELVVTPWLVRRGRPELTLEHAIGQPRWAELFTEAERAEAARRLARAGKSPRRRRGWLRRRGAIIRQAPMTNQLTFNEARDREVGRDDALAGDAVGGPGRLACRPAVPISAGVVMPNGRWCQLRTRLAAVVWPGRSSRSPARSPLLG